LKILSENGNPWGSNHISGFTCFEIWLMQLDILPIHGRPFHPQTQGKDERFNRTLNEEVLKHKEIRDLAHAQEEFDIFRSCYNNVRPHGALKLDCPVQHYKPSCRLLPKTIMEWVYPPGFYTRKVRKGYISIKRHEYYLGEALSGLEVSLRESSLQSCMNVYYRNFKIARINVDEKTFMFRKIYRAEELG